MYILGIFGGKAQPHVGFRFSITQRAQPCWSGWCPFTGSPHPKFNNSIFPVAGTWIPDKKKLGKMLTINDHQYPYNSLYKTKSNMQHPEIIVSCPKYLMNDDWLRYMTCPFVQLCLAMNFSCLSQYSQGTEPL